MFWDVSKQKVKSFALLLTSFITVRLVLISNVKLFNLWLILHICHWILTKYFLRDSSVFPLFFFYFYFSNIFKKIIYLNLLTAVCHYRLLLLISQSLNSVQEGDFSGLLTKAPFPKICRTYPTTMKLGRLIP